MESGPCSSAIAALAGVDMRTRSVRFAARSALGCTGAAAAVVACMRSKSAAQLLATMQSESSLATRAVFFPNVDGHYLPRTPRQAILTGQANRVPVLTGTNHDEGTLFGFLEHDAGETTLNADTYKAVLKQTADDYLPAFTGIVAEAAAALYPLRNYPTPAGYDPYLAPAHLAFGALLTDLLFSCAGPNTYRFTSATGLPTYAYEFSDPDPPSVLSSPASPLRATHASEIQFVFGRSTAIGAGAYEGMTAAQVTLSQRMQSYWANFARTGNPNGPGLPSWPSYRPLLGEIMNLAPSENTIGPKGTIGFGLDHKCLLWGTVDIFEPAVLTIFDLLPTSKAGRERNPTSPVPEPSPSTSPGPAPSPPVAAEPTPVAAATKPDHPKSLPPKTGDATPKTGDATPKTGDATPTSAANSAASPKAKVKVEASSRVRFALRDRSGRVLGRLTATISPAGARRQVRTSAITVALAPGSWRLRLCAGPPRGTLRCSLTARTRSVRLPATRVTVPRATGALRLTAAVVDTHARIRGQGRASSAG